MKYLTLLFLPFLFFCCNEPEETPTGPTEPCESDAIEVSNTDQQATAIMNFGTKLMKELSSASEENVIISPLSIYSALLLAQEGTACDTRKEILRSLELAEGNENISTTGHYMELMEELTSEGPAICKYANALFYDPNRINIREPYQNTLQDFYNATTNTSDFNVKAAVDQINKWAADNTEDKITQVLEEISAEDVAFLLNAIYFKGDWENGFVESPGATIQFTLDDSSEIDVPSMYSSESRAYYSDDETQLVDMQIKGTEYAASFILPSTDSNIDELVQKEDLYTYYLNSVAQAEVTWIGLILPKFELKGNLSLQSAMQALGMESAFVPGKADLSVMTDDTRAHITKILHDTYLKVDEKGIEGAAVTTIGIGITSSPPPVFFGRPFLLILRHIETGVPIFMGKVVNPLEE